MTCFASRQNRMSPWPMGQHPSLSPHASTAFAMLSSSMFMWYESRCTTTLGAPTSATISIACPATYCLMPGMKTCRALLTRP